VFASGETVKGFPWLPGLNFSLILFAEAMLSLVDFPAFMTFDFQQCDLAWKNDELHDIIGNLM
jgi:hypothetical protein